MAVYKSKDLNKNKKSTDGRYASPPKIGKTPKYKTDGRYALPIKKLQMEDILDQKKLIWVKEQMLKKVDVKNSKNNYNG